MCIVWVLVNTISLTSPSLQILGKTQTSMFLISGFLVNPLERKIVMTLKPVMILTWTAVTKFDKINTISTNLKMASCQKIVTSLSFLFLVCKTSVYLKNPRKQTKKISNTALILLLWVMVLFWRKRWVFAKKCWHQQN